LDRCHRGINRTIAALKRSGLKWTGTRQQTKDRWSAITKARNISVAWLACTSAGSKTQKEWNTGSKYVLTCDDTKHIERMVRNLRRTYDAVIVTPHWGNEYAGKPSEAQVAQARVWLEAGAVAIIGNHAHVTQRAQEYKTKSGRKTLIAYCLGNFVSHQGWKVGRKTSSSSEVAKRSSPFLLLGLSKSRGKAYLDSWKYVPLFVSRQDPAACMSINGCKCPKPLGEYVPKSQQRCHSFSVMAADKSSGSKKSLSIVKSKMGKAYSKYQTALNWAKNRAAMSMSPWIGLP
jgi:poly-gamma-glutamate synthesis protein (capsule biosynthesis protein)